jgi:PhnB protein
MATTTPYLFFDGDCRRAMEFYKSCFGGELHVMGYGDAPGQECPPGAKDRVMHAALMDGAFRLMASDVPESDLKRGDNVHVCMDCDSLEQIEKVFPAVAQGGKVGQPLHDAFWGARFGMLTDRFGVHWMFVFDKSKKT